MSRFCLIGCINQKKNHPHCFFFFLQELRQQHQRETRYFQTTSIHQRRNTQNGYVLWYDGQSLQIGIEANFLLIASKSTSTHFPISIRLTFNRSPGCQIRRFVRRYAFEPLILSVFVHVPRPRHAVTARIDCSTRTTFHIGIP